MKSNKTTTSKSFEYRTKLIGRKPNYINILNKEVVVSLKYLSNSCRFLNLSLINCEIELDVPWLRKCIISQMSQTPRIPVNLPVQEAAATKTTGVRFQINNPKLYVPVVTLLVNDNVKFLENIKQEFKRITSWNKYRSEITTQPKNNTLDYLIDSTFRNIKRFFVFSFKDGNNDLTRNSFDEYYMSLVKIKDFNALIDYKPFLDQSVKNNQEVNKKLIEMSRNNDYCIQQEIY